MMSDVDSRILCDLGRYRASQGVGSVLRALFFTNSYRVVLMHRIRVKFRKVLLLSHFLDLLYWQLAFFHSIEIPKGVRLGRGFYIIHSGVVIINRNAIVGRNCTIVSSAVIGGVFRGRRAGAPEIGDDVYIGPNACILGNVKVGHRVAIGANSVVLEDVPDDAVVVGSPAKVISREGSGCYIIRPVE